MICFVRKEVIVSGRNRQQTATVTQLHAAPVSDVGMSRGRGIRPAVVVSHKPSLFSVWTQQPSDCTKAGWLVKREAGEVPYFRILSGR
jgi:hypothetical protein